MQLTLRALSGGGVAGQGVGSMNRILAEHMFCLAHAVSFKILEIKPEFLKPQDLIKNTVCQLLLRNKKNQKIFTETFITMC